MQFDNSPKVWPRSTIHARLNGLGRILYFACSRYGRMVGINLVEAFGLHLRSAVRMGRFVYLGGLQFLARRIMPIVIFHADTKKKAKERSWGDVR